MYRDIPRIERHRLVPREVLTHRGWVAGLDRERQFPRHTSHHRGGGEGGGPYTTMARVGVNDGAVVLRRCLEIEGRRASETFHCLWLVTADEVSSISSDLVAQCLRMPKKKKNHQAASNEWLDVTAIIVHFPPFLSGDATISLSRYIGAGYFYCYAVTHISRSDVLSERFISHVFDKTVYNGSFAVSLYFCAKRLFAEGYSFKGGI